MQNYDQLVAGGFIDGLGLALVQVNYHVENLVDVVATDKIGKARDFSFSGFTESDVSVSGLGYNLASSITPDPTVVNVGAYGSAEAKQFDTWDLGYTLHPGDVTYDEYVNGSPTAYATVLGEGVAKPAWGGNYATQITNNGSWCISVTYYTVPEPATLLALGLGAAALLRARRRNR